MIPTVIAALIVMFAALTITAAQAEDENMTLEEATNASLAEYPTTIENGTIMEED